MSNSNEDEIHTMDDSDHDLNDDDSLGDVSDDSSDDSNDNSNDDSHVQHETASREKYAFTIDNGVVTGISELENGVMQPDSIDSDEQYVVDGAIVLKIESEDSGQEITRYTDEDGDGLYIKVSEQWIAADGTVGAPMPEIYNDLMYFGSSDDDYIGLISDDASTGGLGADQFVFRQLGHMSIADFNLEDDDKIVFDTGLGLQSLEQLASFVTAVNYDGHDIEIEFGNQVSLTLVGCNPADFTGQEFVVLS